MCADKGHCDHLIAYQTRIRRLGDYAFPEERSDIEEGLADMEAGRTVDYEAFMEQQTND